ncbi:hypothetical protein TRFO_43176 [Tritrichomonas foetus]|uniref:Uncharacterized protein n=1 Tax=Tritrichomonas foetus TaxID=1144522 RepID=A0A1J4KWC0_9EUKA|nr:hypothetical protein TRFO_43176 [Tritrichomonas foetus]|eukprot:OHT14044.1 hypothetical protein TRFO_43176 [Tritrichomonas foetus]
MLNPEIVWHTKELVSKQRLVHVVLLKCEKLLHKCFHQIQIQGILNEIKVMIGKLLVLFRFEQDFRSKTNLSRICKDLIHYENLENNINQQLPRFSNINLSCNANSALSFLYSTQVFRLFVFDYYLSSSNNIIQEIFLVSKYLVHNAITSLNS